jgi:hypothetical protein
MEARRPAFNPSFTTHCFDPTAVQKKPALLKNEKDSVHQQPAISVQERAKSIERRYAVIVIAFAVLIATVNRSDADPRIRELEMEGVFHGRGEGEMDLQIVALEFGSRQFGVAVQTGGRDCSGDLRGVATATDATTIVLAKKKEADRSCRLVLKFSNTFQKVAISGKDCSYYHGASCSFNGIVNRIMPS